MVVEFDSDETIDHYDRGWWQTFHDAVDHDDNKAHNMVDGCFVVCTGTFGLDNQYASWTELHPVFGMAVRVSDARVKTIDGNDPQHEMWAVFARNRGDQGGCGGDQVILDLSPNRDGGPAQFNVCLPWRSGSGPPNVRPETALFTNDPTQTWDVNPLQDYGVILTFNLARSDQGSPFVFGELHLQWP
jgi:hypothetical protein